MKIFRISLLLCLALFSSFSFAHGLNLKPPCFNPQVVRWWEVIFELSLEGSYFCRLEGRVIDGNFKAVFLWEGLMEPDEPDVILYHLSSRALLWEAKEKETDGFTSRETDFSSHAPPRLAVKSLIRQDDYLLLDFRVESLGIPLSWPQPLYQLLLPSSSIPEQKQPGIRYNDYLDEGSNRLAIPVKEIARQVYEENFSWSWNFSPDLSPFERKHFKTEHRVKARVRIKPHF